MDLLRWQDENPDLWEANYLLLASYTRVAVFFPVDMLLGAGLVNF